MYTNPVGIVATLNGLLKRTNYYDIWIEKKKNIDLSEEAKGLIADSQEHFYSRQSFSSLTNAQKKKIIRLNRLILEATYPDLVPELRPTKD